MCRVQEREMAEIRENDRRLEMQRKIIEEERQRLLHEHAPKLIGYLPKVRIYLIMKNKMTVDGICLLYSILCVCFVLFVLFQINCLYN